MFHSVTINGKNTWDDYHMIPANGIYLPPPPEQKRTTIDLKTGNGLLDVSTVLTGYPLFQNRSGELQYFILDPWDLDDYIVDNTKMSIGRLEKRIKKYFNDAATNTFFDILRANWDSTNKDYVIIAAVGSNDTQTAITIVRNLVKGGNQNPPVFSLGWSGRNVFACDGSTQSSNIYILAYYTTWSGSSRRYSNSAVTGNSFGYSVIGINSSVNPFGDYGNEWYNHILLPMENNISLSNLTMYCNYDIVQSTSSSTVKYPKSLIYSDDEYRPHTMPNAYDVYSEILNDIHGTSANMTFEDDPGWYWQGNFSVKSMETNSVRRGVVIGYEVSPYKMKSTTVSKSVSTVDASTWASVSIPESDLGTMPVIPTVTVTGTFSNEETIILKFVKQNGTSVEKTIGNAITNTSWPDVVLYKQATVQIKGSSGKTATITFRPGRL